MCYDEGITEFYSDVDLRNVLPVTATTQLIIRGHTFSILSEIKTLRGPRGPRHVVVAVVGSLVYYVLTSSTTSYTFYIVPRNSIGASATKGLPKKSGRTQDQ